MIDSSPSFLVDNAPLCTSPSQMRNLSPRHLWLPGASCGNPLCISSDLRSYSPPQCRSVYPAPLQRKHSVNTSLAHTVTSPFFSRSLSRHSRGPVYSTIPSPTTTFQHIRKESKKGFFPLQDHEAILSGSGGSTLRPLTESLLAGRREGRLSSRVVVVVSAVLSFCLVCLRKGLPTQFASDTLLHLALSGGTCLSRRRLEAGPALSFAITKITTPLPQSRAQRQTLT